MERKESCENEKKGKIKRSKSGKTEEIKDGNWEILILVHTGLDQFRTPLEYDISDIFHINFLAYTFIWPYTFIEFSYIFPPTLLFRPTLLLICQGISFLHFYFSLHLY